MKEPDKARSDSLVVRVYPGLDGWRQVVLIRAAVAVRR